MEGTSLVLSSAFTGPSFSPVPSSQIINTRSMLSLKVNPHRHNVGINCGRILSFCPRASLRGNSEAITGAPTSVPVRMAHELLLAGHRYLDVRTPEEFSAGHVSGAINIPYMYRVGSGMTKNPEFLKRVSSHFGKYDEIIIGCQSGKRSLMAAADLLAAGYNNITDIAGGYVAWRENRLPTEEL